jgi:hypothetical protein
VVYELWDCWWTMPRLQSTSHSLSECWVLDVLSIYARRKLVTCFIDSSVF